MKSTAIGVNTAFSGIGDLTSHIAKLAINAQVASSHLGQAGEPFAILVQELKAMSDSLRSMVRSVEDVFDQIVLNVGNWDIAESMLSLYMSAATKISSSAKPAAETGGGAESGGKEESHAPGEFSDDAMRILRSKIDETENDIVIHQSSLVDNSMKLVRLVSSIRDLVQKQSLYIAITAKIESVRVSDHGDELIHVAENISEVTTNISKVQEKAEGEVYQLVRQIQAFKNRKSGT